jgi:hypothetical protein
MKTSLGWRWKNTVGSTVYLLLRVAETMEKSLILYLKVLHLRLQSVNLFLQTLLQTLKSLLIRHRLPLWIAHSFLPLSSMPSLVFRRDCLIRCRSLSVSDMYLIPQSLAFDTFERLRRALCILDAERRAVRMSEIELGDITVKVLFGAVLINTFHLTFKN